MSIRSITCTVIISKLKTTFTLHISAVRTVSAGHKMVSDGWAAFESACADAGPGDPSLLCLLKGKTNPSPSCRIVTPIMQELINVYNQMNGASQNMSSDTLAHM